MRHTRLFISGSAADEDRNDGNRFLCTRRESNMPKRVFIVEELPRNTMGKVQKNILRDTYKDIYTK